MNKKIEDYLPYYIGQKCLFETDGKTDNGVINPHIIGTCKQVWPVLRPLSDMTREEANVVWEALGLNPDYEESMKRDGNYIATKLKYLQEYFFRKQVFMGHPERFDFRQNVVLVDTLLKQGFDLFGLIAAGLAVDKTKEG